MLNVRLQNLNYFYRLLSLIQVKHARIYYLMRQLHSVQKKKCLQLSLELKSR